MSGQSRASRGWELQNHETLIKASIRGTASLLPGKPRTTEEVLADTGLKTTAEVIREKTGILTRQWMDRDAHVRDVAVTVMKEALKDAGMVAGDLRRLIFVNSTGGDFLIPATANAILDGLGVAHTCDAFDMNNACMGFL
ncbi:MAG: hypothetical protein GXP54_01810, partial [Deltaproteobacteria bacterium]|nr:hypothetical protein [Deltaproteobacteria bacterium]